MAQPSTQQFIPIDNIRDDVIILKGGQMRAVLQVSSINLALKSQDEQDAIIQSYGAFLNSLEFPIQILANSRYMNLDEYLKNLNDMIEKQLSELMQIQTQEYINFIQEFLSQDYVVSTNFYVTVPFSLVDIDIQKGGVQERFKTLLGKQSELSAIDPKEFASYRNQLVQRVEFIASGLHRMGLVVDMLNTEQLISLFWSLYNPEDLKKRSLVKSLFE